MKTIILSLFVSSLALGLECKQTEIATVTPTQFAKLREVHAIPSNLKICGDPSLQYFEPCFELCIRIQDGKTPRTN